MHVRVAVLAAVLVALAIPAFWPDYLSRVPASDPYTHAHALLGFLWLGALLVQPLLARAGRLDRHRAIGRFAVFVGAAFVLSSVLLTHHRASRMDAERFGREGHGFYLPLVMAAIFLAALVLAVRWRRVPSLHARFMVCTALPLLDPLIARLLYFHAPPLPAPFLYQVPAFSIVVATLVGLTRTLPAGSPGRPVLRSFALAVTAALLLYFATPSSDSWLDLLRWFRSLPLT